MNKKSHTNALTAYHLKKTFRLILRSSNCTKKIIITGNVKRLAHLASNRNPVKKTSGSCISLLVLVTINNIL